MEHIEEAWHWFAYLTQINAKEKEELLLHNVLPEVIYRCQSEEAVRQLLKEAGLSLKDHQKEEKIVHSLYHMEYKSIAKKNYEELMKKGIQIVTRKSTNYPEKLRQIAQPPITLYYYGMLPENDSPSIAIIGARNCSVYGEELAAYFAAHLSQAGIQIISGMARGIDASAGRAAISKTGRAYAVLGCGVDVCYPRENKQLYNLHCKNGGVISEELPGSEPIAYRFPKRNRIISALSDGVLIIEAQEKSGSLITAEYALDQGKDLFAIPGRIYDRLSIGCNRLIQAGAKLVCEPEDIMIEFANQLKFCSKNKKEQVLLETDEKIVYANLSLQPKHVEQIALETGFELPELTCVLFNLEMKHYIKQPNKNFYIKNLDDMISKI